MNTSMVTNPHGIFDRSRLGARIGPVDIEIERGRIRFFSQTLGETDPVHTDVDAALNAGYPDLVAPASFFMVVEALADEELARRGALSASALLGFDYRYLLHGDERYFYDGLLFANETVQFSTKVLDFYDKKGGAMEFVVLQSEITHPDRGMLIRSRRTLLHRLPASES